ncbi:MAG: serine hydrolase, partial [Actinobacteria bacterium]|nr:serine hydrolase [Actinomycetota bacterium]
MRRGPKLVRTINAKIAIALVLMALTLMLVPGGPGLAGAQEKASEKSVKRSTTGGNPGIKPPEIEAEAWALLDTDSGLYLTGENPDEQLPTGSVVKIMTALVVLDEGVDLDEEVPISKEAESYVGNLYSNVGLIAGERVTVRDLLAAILMPSGTDAAYALAEHVGGGSVENFVQMMNEKASSMGLENTNFETPAGLDTSDNYSSARDLAILSHEALKYPLFAEIVNTKDATISTQNR